MIRIKVDAPELYPKDYPEDMEKLQYLYSYFAERFEGLEDLMKEIPCKQIGIYACVEDD